MHLRTELADSEAMILAEVVHARQRCDAELRYVLAQIDLTAHVERRVDAGLHREAIRACCTRRVEQRVDAKLARLRRRALDPEFGEARKFLARHECRVDGE